MRMPKRIEPRPGQESVWDYPRPPRVEDVDSRIQVIFNDEVIADTRHARRVLETSHPPVYYIPPDDIEMVYLTRAGRTSVCEWKGHAAYYTVRVGDREVRDAAWFYPDPAPGYESIQDYVAFYPQMMDACFVGDEKVIPQPGDFYGGWITGNVVGPFKGARDTRGW